MHTEFLLCILLEKQPLAKRGRKRQADMKMDFMQIGCEGGRWMELEGFRISCVEPSEIVSFRFYIACN